MSDPPEWLDPVLANWLETLVEGEGLFKSVLKLLFVRDESSEKKAILFL